MIRTVPLVLCLFVNKPLCSDGLVAPRTAEGRSTQTSFSDLALVDRFVDLVRSGMASWGVNMDLKPDGFLLAASAARSGSHFRILAELLSPGDKARAFKKSYPGSEATVKRVAMRAVDDMMRHIRGWPTPGTNKLLAVQQYSNGVSEIVMTDGAGSFCAPLTAHKSRSTSPTALRKGRFAYVTYVAGPPQVWGMDLKDRAPRRLADPSAMHNPTAPALSPDGRVVAVLDSDKRGRQAIRLLDWDTGSLHALTDYQYGLEPPAWSPDGQFLAFIEAKGVESVLCLLDLECRSIQRFVLAAAPIGAPSWHSSGNQLAIAVHLPTNIWQIRVVNPTEKASKVILESGIPISNPRWSPLPQWMAFHGNNGIQILNTNSGEIRTATSLLNSLNSPRWDWGK